MTLELFEEQQLHHMSLSNVIQNKPLYDSLEAVNDAMLIAAKKGTFECVVVVPTEIQHTVCSLLERQGFFVQIIRTSKSNKAQAELEIKWDNNYR